jgi:hypothetical protein
VLFDKDFLLEGDSVAHFHEFMGIARVAVLAGKFAAPVRIDCPGKGHAHTGAAIEQGTDGQSEVFDVFSFSKRFAVSRQAGDSYKLGLGIRQKRKGSHGNIRFLFAQVYHPQIGVRNYLLEKSCA